MDFWICATCGVEHARDGDVCSICADERQWVPPSGQRWTTLAELAGSGRRIAVTELEPHLYGITSEPKVGIGQQSKLLCTPAGCVLWDPIGYLDDAAVLSVRQRGKVVAVAASHPHMFGVQVEWSRALGGAPVWVAVPDWGWVARPDPVIRPWSGTVDLLPGVTLVQVGGHFPGSAVLHWAGGAGGKGVLLGSDTIFANPDRGSVSFMRSFPNRIPLSPAVVERLVEHIGRFDYDRLYGNFADVIECDAQGVVRRSADRHIDWVRGTFDDQT